MAFKHNNKVADNEPDWSKVDKTALPRIAFADQGDENNKGTWKFPHHWVKGGTEKDERGIWKDGELYLHRGGLIAAWAAAMGARSGQKASDEVIAHLREHRKALGMEDDDKSSSSTDDQAFAIDAKVAALFSEGEWAIDAKYMQNAFFRVLIPNPYDDIATINGRRAVIHIRDVLTNDEDWIGTSYTAIRRSIDNAVSKGVEEIIFDIDSPGGEVKGLFGLVSHIRNLRDKAKTTAVVNESAYSAAYAIASAAEKVVMARTGGVGSIGVIAAHVDVSGADAMHGLKWTIVTAGEYKDLLNPHRPVSTEDIEYMRERTEGLYDILVSTIAKNRGLDASVIRGLGARLFHGEMAIKVGLVDEIVDDAMSIIEGTEDKMSDVKQHAVGATTNQNTGDVISRQEAAEIIRICEQYKHLLPDGYGAELIENGVPYAEALKMILDKIAGTSDKDAVQSHISSHGLDKNPLIEDAKRRWQLAEILPRIDELRP